MSGIGLADNHADATAFGADGNHGTVRDPLSLEQAQPVKPILERDRWQTPYLVMTHSLVPRHGAAQVSVEGALNR